VRFEQAQKTNRYKKTCALRYYLIAQSVTIIMILPSRDHHGDGNRNTASSLCVDTFE